MRSLTASSTRSTFYSSLRYQAYRDDPRDRACLVIVGRVACNTDRTDRASSLSDYDNAACRRNDPARRQARKRANEGRPLARHFGNLAAGHAERERSSGLCRCDLGAQRRGPILTLEGNEVPARIEHGDTQRLEAEPQPLRQGRGDNAIGLIKREDRQKRCLWSGVGVVSTPADNIVDLRRDEVAVAATSIQSRSAYPILQ